MGDGGFAGFDGFTLGCGGVCGATIGTVGAGSTFGDSTSRGGVAAGGVALGAVGISDAGLATFVRGTSSASVVDDNGRAGPVVVVVSDGTAIGAADAWGESAGCVAVGASATASEFKSGGSARGDAFMNAKTRPTAAPMVMPPAANHLAGPMMVSDVRATRGWECCSDMTESVPRPVVFRKSFPDKWL